MIFKIILNIFVFSFSRYSHSSFSFLLLSSRLTFYLYSFLSHPLSLYSIPSYFTLFLISLASFSLSIFTLPIFLSFHSLLSILSILFLSYPFFSLLVSSHLTFFILSVHSLISHFLSSSSSTSSHFVSHLFFLHALSLMYFLSLPSLLSHSLF